MTEITYRQAKERLSAPDADLNSLRAELAVLMKAIDDNRFPYDPERPFCPGFILWTNPDNPAQMVRVRNGQISCIDGAQHGISVERLWITQTSEHVDRARLDFGGFFSHAGADEFKFSEVLEGLEEIVGCKVHTKVCYGFDGFYQFVFERQFKACDRQRLKAEMMQSFLQKYDFVLGRSYITVEVGRISVTIQLHKGEHGDYTKKG